MSENKLRIRWAAIGAAIAVTIGTGGLIGVNAAQTDQSSTFVPVTPTRILDTRSSTKIGDLTEGSTTELQVTGSIKTSANETKVVVPTGSTAVSANVTVVAGETGPNDGYVTVYPCDVKRPDASSLNFVNAQTIPNAVSVPLSANGKVCIFVYGKAHILFDVVGYYSTTSISDLNASISRLESELKQKSPITMIKDSLGQTSRLYTFPGDGGTYILQNDSYYPVNPTGFASNASIGNAYFVLPNCQGDVYTDTKIVSGDSFWPSGTARIARKFSGPTPTGPLTKFTLSEEATITSLQIASWSSGASQHVCYNSPTGFPYANGIITKIVWGDLVTSDLIAPFTYVSNE